jgi:hypothetical protein
MQFESGNFERAVLFSTGSLCNKSTVTINDEFTFSGDAPMVLCNLIKLKEHWPTTDESMFYESTKLKGAFLR